MSRSYFAFSLLAALAVFCLAGPSFAHPLGAGAARVALAADENAADAGAKADKAQVRTKDAGSIDGDVVSVDYHASRFTLKAGATTYDIIVLPSTDFEGHSNDFHGIADIKKGAHVSVMLSQRAATYTAQIIHLR